jgi:hypothetical protein
MATKTLTYSLENTTFIEISTYRLGSPPLPTPAKSAKGGGTDLWSRRSLEAAARSKRRRLQGKELREGEASLFFQQHGSRSWNDSGMYFFR